MVHRAFGPATRTQANVTESRFVSLKTAQSRRSQLPALPERQAGEAGNRRFLGTCACRLGKTHQGKSRHEMPASK